MKDLAERLTGVLRGGEALPLTAAQEQGFAIGRKGNDGPELATLAAGRIVPQNIEPLQPLARRIANQLASRVAEGATTGKFLRADSGPGITECVIGLAIYTAILLAATFLLIQSRDVTS